MLQSTHKSHPAIAEIEHFGFTYSEDAQFDLTKLSKDRRVQVREHVHYAPTSNVLQYSVQMKSNAFPAIVVTRNGYTVDGNTRIGACEKNGLQLFPAIIIDADYHAGDEKIDARIIAIAAAMNMKGGERLTTTEMRVAVHKLVEAGMRSDLITRVLGVKNSVIQAVKAEQAAVNKFAKIGFANIKGLQPAVMRYFGTEKLINLNDKPAKLLADLAVQANLNVNEVRDLVTAMFASGSEAAMVKIISDARGSMSARIEEHRIHGTGKPAVSAQLRRVLGLVTKYESDIVKLVERSPKAMQEHLALIEKTIEILGEVIESQRAMINA